MGAEEEYTCGTRASVLFGKIRRITVDVQLHITCVVSNDSIGVSGTIVQELCHCLDGGLSAVSLGGSQCAEGNEHGGVDCSSIIEECANDFLQARGAGRG